MPNKKIAFSVLLSALGLIAPMAAAAPAASALAPSSSSEAELCFGQVPTIVGSPGESIAGTDGPDVVVTNGAYRGLGTGDGDDLVCVRGAVDDGGYSDAVLLDTGQGDDRIDTSAAVKGSTYDVIVLGGGADEFIGGTVPDVVLTGEYPDFFTDDDVDVVMTGGGPDRVLSNGGSDALDLGRGRDTMYLHGVPASTALLAGGGGEDQLGLDLLAIKDPHEWIVDNRAQRLFRDGQVVSSWDGFSRFGLAMRGSVLFLGSDGDETVDFRREYGTHAPFWHAKQNALDVRMRGGDDVLHFYGGAEGSRFNGGQGRDELQYERVTIVEISRAQVVFDLERGVLRDIRRDKSINRRASNFENATVVNSGGLTALKGTAGPNILRTSWDAYSAVSHGTLSGRAGNDRLVGSDWDDVLIGGAGDDMAKGRHGHDRCKAESKLGCEA